MASLISRSSTCWSPTFASVELPMPMLPICPVPKLDKSASANPARMATPIAATTQVPILELEIRRKKESIGFPVRLEDGCPFRGETGVHQAAPLGLGKGGTGAGEKDAAEEA